jgi:hypothetical protein
MNPVKLRRRAAAQQLKYYSCDNERHHYHRKILKIKDVFLIATVLLNDHQSINIQRIRNNLPEKHAFNYHQR